MMPTVQVVIPSRKRADMVAKAAALFIDPVICIDEVELADYKSANPELRFITHPSVSPLQRIRQWILDNVEADVIFQCDDDVHRVWRVIGNRERRLYDPRMIQDIVINAALNCQQAGTCMFWFAQTTDPKECDPLFPFKLMTQPVGNAMGYWRKEFNRKIRHDPNIQRAGIDAALRVLFHHRIIWCDSRYCFKPGPHMTAEGGLAGLRTVEALNYDDAEMKRRYGDALTIDHFSQRNGRKNHVKLRVKR